MENNGVMALQDDASSSQRVTLHQFRYDAKGLRGKRLRLLTDVPTDDAGVPQDLPVGITDVISTEDEVGPNLSLRVHPLGDPKNIAYVAFDQLALYEEATEPQSVGGGDIAPGIRVPRLLARSVGRSSRTVEPVEKHAFISYVRENNAEVDRLCKVLDAAGIPYWRDRSALGPGDAWKVKIRDAIRSGSIVFLACFSEQSRAKGKSYMNEELTLAVDEFRLRSPGQPWLIPVRFDRGDIPEWGLGAGRMLSDLNYADLFGDEYAEHAVQLVEAIKAAMGTPGLEPATVRAAVQDVADADQPALVRRVEALRLVAERTRGGPRSWSRRWQQLRQQTRRSFIAWDDDGNAVYPEPSEMDLRPIREGIRSALDAALDEVTPAAEAARIELAAVRATRTQVAPWCDALDRAITQVIDTASTWTVGPGPEADTAFDTALADLQQSVTDLVRASRGEQVDMPEPPQVVSEHKDVDPLAEHRDLLDQARPFSRVSHRPYDPELRERVAEATRQAAAMPPTLHFLSIDLDTTARLAVAVAGNASEDEQLDLVERDRQRLPICAAAALLQAATLPGDGQNGPATAAREQLRRLFRETDWSNATSWVGNDVNGRLMMQAFARVTSDEEVRARLAQVLEADPDLLAPLVVSCAGWIEEHDTQTGLVRFDRVYDEPPPWLPIEAIKALAADVLGNDHGLDDREILEALLKHAGSGS
jgi:TIR domain